MSAYLEVFQEPLTSFSFLERHHAAVSGVAGVISGIATLALCSLTLTTLATAPPVLAITGMVVSMGILPLLVGYVAGKLLYSSYQNSLTTRYFDAAMKTAPTAIQHSWAHSLPPPPFLNSKIQTKEEAFRGIFTKPRSSDSAVLEEQQTIRVAELQKTLVRLDLPKDEAPSVYVERTFALIHHSKLHEASIRDRLQFSMCASKQQKHMVFSITCTGSINSTVFSKNLTELERLRAEAIRLASSS